MVPQNEEKFPEPDKSNNDVKTREIYRVANDKCNTKWKSTKNLRKRTEKPVERFRTRYNEKLKQRRKIVSNPYKNVKRTLINEIKRNKCENIIKIQKIPMTEAEVVESAF
jgi:protein-arginine kinase activator protein McsA